MPERGAPPWRCRCGAFHVRVKVGRDDWDIRRYTESEHRFQERHDARAAERGFEKRSRDETGHEDGGGARRGLVRDEVFFVEGVPGGEDFNDGGAVLPEGVVGDWFE